MIQTIDSYGFNATSEYFQKKRKHPYLVEKLTGGVTYICFDKSTGNIPIWKVEKTETSGTATTTVSWGFGKWSKRGTISYNYDTNQPASFEMD